MSLPDKIKNKKGIVIVAIVLIAVAIGGGATLAYFTSTTREMHNEFKGAAVNISVIENHSKEELNNNQYQELEDEKKDTNGNINTFSSITKGTEAPKIVRIKNKDTDNYHTVDTYVRVRLVPKLVYDDTNEEGYAGQTSVNLSQGDVHYTWANQVENAKWMESEVNGQKYYYYTKALKPGEISNVLLTAVTYNGVIPTGQHFELEVLTEGIAAGQHSKDNANGERAEYNEAWKNVLNVDSISVNDLSAQQ